MELPVADVAISILSKQSVVCMLFFHLSPFLQSCHDEEDDDGEVKSFEVGDQSVLNLPLVSSF